MSQMEIKENQTGTWEKAELAKSQFLLFAPKCKCFLGPRSLGRGLLAPLLYGMRWTVLVTEILCV